MAPAKRRENIDRLLRRGEFEKRRLKKDHGHDQPQRPTGQDERFSVFHYGAPRFLFGIREMPLPQFFLDSVPVASA